MQKEQFIKLILLTGFILGVMIRVFMLFYKGTYDMDSYVTWGNDTLSQGLHNAYRGIYFPLQYQLFSIASIFVPILKVDYWIVFKALNLLFDIGIFVLLFNILSKLKINPVCSLLYWLHPWFLMVYSLGYIDFHLGFFVLLSIYILLNLKNNDLVGYIIAGIPIGCAFLLKPQTQCLIVAIGFISLIYYLKTKNYNIFGLLVFSAVMFLAYSFYFFFSLKPLYFLAKSYLAVSSVMPCLNADMPNIWYPVAYFMRPDPALEIYSVSDKLHILPFISFKALAALLTTGSICYYSYLISKQMKEQFSNTVFILIFSFSFFALPFLMTSAHENHLFVASIFLLILSFKAKDLFFKISVHITLLLQCLNISLLYSEDRFFNWLRKLLFGYKIEVRFIFALVSLAFLTYIFFYFFKTCKTNPFLQELNEKEVRA